MNSEYIKITSLSRQMAVEDTDLYPKSRRARNKDLCGTKKVIQGSDMTFGIRDPGGWLVTFARAAVGWIYNAKV